MVQPLSLVGLRSGKLIVLKRAGSRGTNAQWLCQCDCGKQTLVISARLSSGKTRSCGCLVSEAVIARSTKHGARRRGVKNSTYEIWKDMHKRCNAKTGKNYKWYGAKGITVCERWKSYENFLADMGERPSPEMSIDRKQNTDGYNPENCRWATPIQQANNRCIVKLFEYCGESKSLPDWARDVRCVVSRWTLIRRVSEGWEIGKALTTSARSELSRAIRDKRAVKRVAFGESKCLSDWADDPKCVISVQVLRSRVSRGWDIERAITEPKRGK